jgi:hypothetical protein
LLQRLLFAFKSPCFTRGRKIAPTARFATVFYTSPRRLLQNLGLKTTTLRIYLKSATSAVTTVAPT